MECIPRDENYTILNASQLTEKMMDDYRSCLSTASFKWRWPVVSYLVVLTVVGFFSDAVVITVYSLRFRACASRIFVLAMAVCDITTSAVGLPLHILTIRYSYDTPGYWLCRGFFALATLPTQASGLVLTAVAVDRAHRVWWPHSRHLTARQCVWVNVVIIVLACVIFGCFVPLYGIHHRDSHIPGVPVHMCWTDNNVIDTPYLQAYSYTVNVIFYGSLLTMVTCYVMIGFRVWRMSPGKKMKKMGKGTAGQATTSTSPASWTVTSQSADKTETLPETDPTVMDTDRYSPSPSDDDLSSAEESGDPEEALSLRATKVAVSSDIDEQGASDKMNGQSYSATSTNLDHVPEEQNRVVSLGFLPTFGDAGSATSGNVDDAFEEQENGNEQGPEQKYGAMFSSLAPEPSQDSTSISSYSASRPPSPPFVHDREPEQHVALKVGEDRPLTFQEKAALLKARVPLTGKGSGLDSKTAIQVRAATGPSRTGRVRNRTTLIMFVLTVCYTLNWLPHNYMRFIRTDPVNWCDNYVDCGYNVYALCLRSYYISSAVNGIVYSFICIRFRNECVNIAKSVWRRLRRKI